MKKYLILLGFLTLLIICSLVTALVTERETLPGPFENNEYYNGGELI